jgi:tetratricopeptide (TPR) repeat protein
LVSLNGLGVVLRDGGNYEQADKVLREALALRRQALPGDDPDTIQSIFDLGWLLKEAKHFTEAETLLREAYEGNVRVFGPDHPRTIGSQHILGIILRDLAKYDVAEPLCRELYARTSDPIYRAGYGICLAQLHRVDEAEPILVRSFDELKRTNNLTKRVTRDVANALVLVYEKLGQTDNAMRWKSEIASIDALTKARPTTAPANRI